jgi:hypothetical protein
MGAEWAQRGNMAGKLLAQVAELADALASGASGRKVVEVRVLSWAPSAASPGRLGGVLLRRPTSFAILTSNRRANPGSLHIGKRLCRK